MERRGQCRETHAPHSLLETRVRATAQDKVRPWAGLRPGRLGLGLVLTGVPLH